MARKIAKDIVQAGYADRCEVQLAYAIGVVQPVGVSVECFGTEHEALDFIQAYIQDSYDLTPQGIISGWVCWTWTTTRSVLTVTSVRLVCVGGITYAVQTEDTVSSPRLPGAGGGRPALL